jgi:hypothetical protein
MGINNPNDQLEFDLGENEQETEVVLQTPEEKPDQENQTDAPVDAAEQHRTELDAVSDSVQKRIAKLTARMREAERQREAALEYAKGLQNKTHDLEKRLVHTDYSRLNEAKQRLDTQQLQLKAIIKKAREEGDLDTEVEATQRLTDLQVDQRNVSQWLESQQRQIQQPEPQVNPFAAMQQQQPPPQQQPRKPSVRAEQWAQDNKWFGKNRVMTYAAWGIHQSLVEDEGIDPESDEYYTELDSRLRDQFPKQFQQEAPVQPRAQRSAPAVAPASRSSGVNSARRAVKLSPSQVAMAKKLGVPIEEYAKYVKE